MKSVGVLLRCLRIRIRIFLAALSKVFPKASLSLMKEQVSRLAKSAAPNIFSYFASFGYTGERRIPGLRRKDWKLRALSLAVTSLWPQKVSSRGEIYSARWKFMLISDQVKDLVKNCFEGGGCMSPFQPLVYIRAILAGHYFGPWYKKLIVKRKQA